MGCSAYVKQMLKHEPLVRVVEFQNENRLQVALMNQIDDFPAKVRLIGN
jgi:hypothetical protein